MASIFLFARNTKILLENLRQRHFEIYLEIDQVISVQKYDKLDDFEFCAGILVFD